MVEDKPLAHALLRVTLGINLLMHGAVRLFGDYKGFATQLIEVFQNTFIPDQAVQMLALTLPPIELVLGVLIALGLFTRWSVASGALLMVVLIIGQCTLMNWDSVGLQMVYSITYFLVLFNRQHNTYSVDAWLRATATPSE